jgi:hypothetical protein
MFRGVDEGLDVFFDGDAADVDDHFVCGREAQSRSEFVAIDERVDSAGIGAVSGIGNRIVAWFAATPPQVTQPVGLR